MKSSPLSKELAKPAPDRGCFDELPSEPKQLSSNAKKDRKITNTARGGSLRKRWLIHLGQAVKEGTAAVGRFFIARRHFHPEVTCVLNEGSDLKSLEISRDLGTKIGHTKIDLIPGTTSTTFQCRTETIPKHF